MKKLIFSLLGCLTLIQAVQAEVPALTSPLNLSLMQYEALTTTLGSNPDFQTMISQGEFIIDLRIQRRSLNVNQGNVYVNITTWLPAKNEEVSTQEKNLSETKAQAKPSRPRCYGRPDYKRSNITKTYRATLLLTPSNAGIPSVTVVRIEPVTQHCQTFIGKENQVDEHYSNELENIK